MVLFGRPSACRRYSDGFSVGVDGVVVRGEGSVRNLGLQLDSTLRFRDHIVQKTRAAFAAIKLIYNIRHVISRDVKLKLCESLVLSHFNYCDIVYSSCLDHVGVRRVQRVQNACLRLVYGLNRRDHVSSVLVRAGWLNMYNRRKLHLLTFFHKLMLTGAPPYLYNKIKFRTDVHNVNVRTRGLITPPHHRTALFERSFTYNVAKLYNPLPVSVKSMSVHKFRRTVFGILMHEQCSML